MLLLVVGCGGDDALADGNYPFECSHLGTPHAEFQTRNLMPRKRITQESTKPEALNPTQRMNNSRPRRKRHRSQPLQVSNQVNMLARGSAADRVSAFLTVDGFEIRGWQRLTIIFVTLRP